jgi:hypothetical protein
MKPEQYALYCPRKGYYSHKITENPYPVVSLEVKEAKQYKSEEDANRVRMHDQYLYWFRPKRII